MKPQDTGSLQQRLSAENAELKLRLREAEDTLLAIQRGDVDALVVESDIYTLESARDTTNRLREDVLAQMEDAVFAFDARDRVIFMNAAAERLYGLSSSSSLGKAKAELYREEPADDTPHAAASARSGIPSRSYSIHRRNDGSPLHVESTVSPLKGAAGQWVGSLAVIRDVSARIRADDTIRLAAQELARRERQFATLVENAPDIFARMDREFRHLYVSPIVKQYSGIAPQAHLGKTNAELGMPAGLCAQWNAALEQVFVTGQVGRVKFAFTAVSGVNKVFDSRLIPEFADDGSVESVLSIASDITEQEAVDLALRQSQAQLRFILESAEIGDWELDLGTDIGRISGRCALCFGYAEAPQTWSGAIMLEHVDVHDKAHVAELLRKSRNDQEDLHFECRVVWPDGSTHWIEAHGTHYAAHGSSRLVGIVTDVTLRKQTEESLRDADRRKDQFLATLAHELRNPLAPIRNALHVMHLTGDPAQQEKARAVIGRQLGQMVHLVDDLLDVSRISQGKVELRKEHVDIAAILQTAIETSKPLIEAGRHELSTCLPPAGSLVVDADPTRLCQIVANLLNNAAKYTPEGGRIEVSARQEQDVVVISVADSGVGIPTEMLPRVFDMFAQVDRSLSRAQGGLGIGLALVKRLAEMHGGSVEARSEGLDRGSRFSIRMPLLPLGANHPSMPSRQGSGSVEQGHRILVVDDNKDSATSMAEILSLLGHQTFFAHDGEEAVALASQLKPSIVLMDIGLPKLTGHEAASRIRQQPGGKDLLLIALSGWGRDEDIRKSLHAGFDRHFAKPVDLEMLLDLISRHR